ncbi:hypothetical protein NL676_007223 [Syzygium grande]|nr:hypothetical protein NL676_007223 [Syzygium grande]
MVVASVMRRPPSVDRRLYYSASASCGTPFKARHLVRGASTTLHRHAKHDSVLSHMTQLRIETGEQEHLGSSIEDQYTPV